MQHLFFRLKREARRLARCACAAGLAAAFLLPETKGKTLEEIEKYFEK